jgi:hypothetical protein
MLDGGRYLPLATATLASFKLAVQRGGSRKRIEALSPDMEQLLDLNRQLEALGYQFMSLQRLEAPDEGKAQGEGDVPGKPKGRPTGPQDDRRGD